MYNIFELKGIVYNDRIGFILKEIPVNKEEDSLIEICIGGTVTKVKLHEVKDVSINYDSGSAVVYCKKDSIDSMQSLLTETLLGGSNNDASGARSFHYE
ncbi:hypothetical protein [Paenibacillus taichungensis]